MELPFASLFRKMQCGSGHLKFLALASGAFTCLPATAQNEPDLDYLIFEPVVLEVTADSEEADISARELTTLPGGTERSTLRSILRSANRRNDNSLDLAVVSDTGEDVLNEDLLRYQASVREMEIDGGAYEPGLVQELLSLASVHQGLDQHASATELLERASHINRVTQGLFNLDQIPIIHETIESHLAMGNIAAADQQQQYLYYIQQKAFGTNSAEVLPALIAWADWNVLTADLRLTPEVRAKLATEPGFRFRVPQYLSIEESRAQRLITAQNLYRSSIEIILQHFGISDIRLLEIEERLALTNYFFATYFAASGGPGFNNAGGGFVIQTDQVPINGTYISSNSMGYRFGKDAMERRVEYLRENPDSDPMAEVDALVDLGDWYLLFDKRVAANETYSEAYALMINTDPEGIEEKFHPLMPQWLPKYSTRSYSRQRFNIPDDISLVYHGFIDISFTNTQYGLPTNIDVINSSSNALEEIEDRLVRHIRNLQFRPRFLDGEPVDQDSFTIRYYFTY